MKKKMYTKTVVHFICYRVVVLSNGIGQGLRKQTAHPQWDLPRKVQRLFRKLLVGVEEPQRMVQ